MPGVRDRLEVAALLVGTHLPVPNDALRIGEGLGPGRLGLAAETLKPQVRGLAGRVIDNGHEPGPDLDDERLLVCRLLRRCGRAGARRASCAMGRISL